jgi:AraC family transcriptional regulator
MIGSLNQLIDFVEAHISDELDVAQLATRSGTTEYHLRRMFSSLVGMPLSEYIRRRRMTLAAAEVIAGKPLLDVAVTFGYGSSDAFGRAFLSVHGATPGEVRRNGGPLFSQQKLRFRLTVEGTTTMDTRILDRSSFTLVGHSTRVPLLHHGANPHIQSFIAALPPEEHARLKVLSDGEPTGLLQVSADVDPDYTEGSELTYLHGVAVASTTQLPDDLDAIEVDAGQWAVFTTTGPYPATLQGVWATTATEWFPSNPWRLRPGPSIVAVVERAEDFSTATTELWLPVERA